MAYTQCASMHAYICTFVLKCSCCLVNLVIITQLSSVNNNYIYTAIIGTLKKHQSNNTPSIQSQEGELFFSHCLSLINNSPFMFFKQLKQCKTKAMRNISKEEMWQCSPACSVNLLFTNIQVLQIIYVSPSYFKKSINSLTITVASQKLPVWDCFFKAKECYSRQKKFIYN